MDGTPASSDALVLPTGVERVKAVGVAALAALPGRQ